MLEKTRLQYISIGENFVKIVKEKYPEYGHIPPQKYIEELLKRAETTTPAYWRRLRTAYAEWCFEKGHTKQGKKIKTVRNPLTVFGEYRKNPLPDSAKKRKKATTLNDADYIKIQSKAGSDEEIKAVMEIMKGLGVRPSEIKNIEILKNEFFISGAKKNEKNNRGLDRFVEVLNKTQQEEIIKSINLLKDAAEKKEISFDKLIDRTRRRFDLLTKKVFPKRKLHVCLYTLRHQFGSNLKSNGLSRSEIAYIMGHQSTKSIERYGDRRQGNSKVSIVVSRLNNNGGDLNMVRENHKPIDSARQYVKRYDSAFVYK